MPTKPNRAGQQQNYVPKGNGDASGEYGDNATGSNKHFTAFKQPGQQPQPTPAPKKQPKPSLENGEIVEKKPKEGKKLTKRERIIKENEDAFKKSFPNTKVNFSGYTPSAQKTLVDSANRILQDFPNLKDYLKEYGNPNAMTKEETQRAIQKELDAITDEKIEEYRQKFKRWNNIDDDRMERVYNHDWAKEKLIEMAKRTYVPKRASIGRACAITCHSAWGNVQDSKIYFKEKYIGDSAEKTCKDLFDINWWSSKAKDSVAHHELGHALDNYLFTNYYTRGYREQIKDLYHAEQARIRAKTREVAGKDWETNDAKRILKEKGEKLYNISEYGMTDAQEFIAECVAAHYGGENNPLAEKVFDLMLKAEKEIQYVKSQNEQARKDTRW